MSCSSPRVAGSASPSVCVAMKMAGASPMNTTRSPIDAMDEMDEMHDAGAKRRARSAYGSHSADAATRTGLLPAPRLAG